MKSLSRMMALAVALATTVTATSSYADTVLIGTTDGGAFFKIVVPTGWNGDLVIWNHGFSLDPVGPVADLGPLSPLQLSEGYAVAASSYQQIGWALFQTKTDLQNMIGVFKANFGNPSHVWINGASLGGIVSDQADEKANLGNVVGAYPICGVHGGSINWNAALDLRLLYDLVCSNTPAAAIPGGTTGLPAPGFPGFSFSTAQLAIAVNACTGILTPPGSRTPQQSDNLKQLLSLTQTPPNFLLTDIGFALFGMSNLIFDPQKLAGGQGMGNSTVNYDNGGPVDLNITRVAPDPGAQNRLDKNYIANGNVGNTKVVSLHTDKDGLVIVENENFYASVVPPSNLTTAIAVEEVPTHCGFTPAEAIAGWESLRLWVGDGVQPTAQDIDNTCNVVAAKSPGTGPCRFDPSFVIPPLSDRIRPR
jgi:hypothetical protein